MIGSGFGGLAAAIRLGARGYRVTVVEKLSGPGGRAGVLRQDGFTFDLGPTIVTAPFLFEELWALCGRRMADDVELRAMTPFYQIRFQNGDVFNMSGDEAAMRAEVARFNPDDVEGFERFMRRSEAIYRIGFERLGDAPFSSIVDMARIAGDLVRLGGHRSVYGLVSKYIRDERLRTVFSFHPLLIGGNPFRASAIYCLIPFLEKRWGVHFAMGGTGALVTGLVKLIEWQGGELALRRRSRIHRCRGRQPRPASGSLRARRFGRALSSPTPIRPGPTAVSFPPPRASGGRTARLDRARYSMGLFVWYFGTNRRYEEVAHHTILLGPRYRELLRDIFDLQAPRARFQPLSASPDRDRPRPSRRKAATRSTSCRRCPICLAARTGASKRSPTGRRIARALEASILPGLTDALVTSHVATPLDFQSRLNSYHGAGFSLEPILTQSAWFRPHNASEDVRNLFLVGAGVHPGAGLPGVLSSARILDKVAPHASVFA